MKLGRRLLKVVLLCYTMWMRRVVERHPGTAVGK